MKKYFSLFLGIGMLSTLFLCPVFVPQASASAETDAKTLQLIQILTEMVQKLMEQLQALLAQQNQGNVSKNWATNPIQYSPFSNQNNYSAANIASVESAGNYPGTVYANHKASIHGAGLSGQLTIKLGNIEPKYISIVGTSDSYAEFIVPSQTQSSVVSLIVNNSSGKSSNIYQLKIDPDVPGVITQDQTSSVVLPKGGELFYQNQTFDVAISYPSENGTYVFSLVTPDGQELSLDSRNVNGATDMLKTSFIVPGFGTGRGDATSYSFRLKVVEKGTGHTFYSNYFSTRQSV